MEKVERIKDGGLDVYTDMRIIMDKLDEIVDFINSTII